MIGKGFKSKAGLDFLLGSDDDREIVDNWSIVSVLFDEGVSSIFSEDGTYFNILFSYYVFIWF